MSKKKKKNKPNGPVRFVTEYRHYRTGKLMRARDYGYKAWPFGR
jgi:hypothetical protein